MPWPGTPSSETSPPLNVPSTRLPVSIAGKADPDVVEAISQAYDGLTVHEQAFAALPAQIAAAAKAAATTAVTEQITQETVTGVTSFNTLTGAVIYFPNLGMVNDQLGNPLYLTQQSDAGQKIIMGDSSPSTLELNGGMQPPWFAFIGNDSSATVMITADSGASVNGLDSIYPGGIAFAWWDGTTFWVEGVGLAADSTYGVVMPDFVTITADSGVISTIGATGTIPLGPLTDSGASGHISVSKGLITGWVSPT
jgi:hypothetical protein